MKTRKDYKEKFNRLFSQYNYIPQDREQIIQCQKPYPPYMFISNSGYLWSVYRDELYLLKPHAKGTGKKNRKGNRAGFTWYYWIRNRHVDMAKIMADHFLENEFDAKEYHIHHKKKRNTFSVNEPQKCNRADNLQILPKDVHIGLTKLASKTFEEHDKELRADVSKRNVPTVHLPQQLGERRRAIC
jgi:hypothetical protein